MKSRLHIERPMKASKGPLPSTRFQYTIVYGDARHIAVKAGRDILDGVFISMNGKSS